MGWQALGPEEICYGGGHIRGLYRYITLLPAKVLDGAHCHP